MIKLCKGRKFSFWTHLQATRELNDFAAYHRISELPLGVEVKFIELKQPTNDVKMAVILPADFNIYAGSRILYKSTPDQLTEVVGSKCDFEFLPHHIYKF